MKALIQVNIRISEEEKDILKAFCKKHGIKRATVFRKLIRLLEDEVSPVKIEEDE
jgi:predicted DNA-binding protein